MKKSILIKKLFLTLIFILTQVIYAPITTQRKALNLTEVDKSTACNLLSTAGELLGDFNDVEKARACLVCGDEWEKNEKDNSKALKTTCGQLGAPTEKHKVILTKALADAVASPDKNCENLGLLYSKFDLFTNTQRVQAASTCFGKWTGQRPKAQKALISTLKPDDIDESKEKKIGDIGIPSWDEVAQEQTLDRANPKGQFTLEITQEQYKTITKK